MIKGVLNTLCFFNDVKIGKPCIQKDNIAGIHLMYNDYGIYRMNTLASGDFKIFVSKFFFFQYLHA